MPERGSVQIIRERCPFTLPEGTVDKISEVIEARGGKCIGVLCVGQPQPDGIYGTIELDSAKGLGGLVRDLLHIEGLPLVVKAFPYGIPIPDLFHVQFETPGFEARR
jgi:hypothetical protein